jgi:UDP-N-acetylmuramoyl-L-alanyl-D-glutamate--2,6-diaminopimelate ligase
MAVIDYPPPPDFWRDFSTVGITGTNGKTTTTLYVAAALSVLGRPVANVTTLGHALDTEPLDVEIDYDGFIEMLRLCHERGGRHAAIECTSEALASGFMRAWPCQISVFTNLSHDHLAAHGTAEHYLASKAQLFVQLPPGGFAILNREDPNSALLAEVVPKHATILWYGTSAEKDLDLELSEATPSWQGTQLRARLRDRELAFSVRAIGAVFGKNACAALLASIAAGADPERAASAIAQTANARGRFEVVSERPYAVVDYAHTPDALERILETGRTLGARKITLVFGAGGNADPDKRLPMGQVATAADRIIVTSDNPRREDPRKIADDLLEGIGNHADVTVELDRSRAIELALQKATRDDLVIVAGKGHETSQIVGDEAFPFSDRQVIVDTLARLS